jgi:hypothetical protein
VVDAPNHVSVNSGDRIGLRIEASAVRVLADQAST